MKIHLRPLIILFSMALVMLVLASCAAKTAVQTVVVKETVEVVVKETQVVEVKATEIVEAPPATSPPQPTQPPAAAATATPDAAVVPSPITISPTPIGPVVIATQPLPTATSVPPESRLVELEWPPVMRLGESDVVRLALIPAPEGYTVVTEFPDHTTFTQTVSIPPSGGYELSSVARLDAAGFDVSPEGEQLQYLPAGQPVVWRWSLTPHNGGRQRLSVSLGLRWTPLAGTPGGTRDTIIFSKSLEVRVTSFFGLTRNQTMAGGFMGLVFGGSVSLFSLSGLRRPARRVLKILSPNPGLVIEPRPGLNIPPAERSLLQALFRRYGRLAVESEFLSGYSGARTFLALPIHPDGRTDAHTIVKIGDADSIRREYENYETFVKDTLPPITARIQHAPITLPSALVRGSGGEGSRAAVQYTFIGAPGHKPASLRQALLADPSEGLLNKLFETFGPNWWMQRRPYTFRLAQEYDRVLPAHWVIAPDSGRGRVLDGKTPPGESTLAVGDLVTLRNFTVAERRPDGQSLSLRGSTAPGQPPIRLRWLSLSEPNGAVGRVVATRATLLYDLVAGLDRFGLPDPFEKLPALLDETVSGTRSVIHGDLNLENVLVGPGGFVWLIDFAQTREGHPLFDFAHLESELIAHVIAPQIADPSEYARLLQSESVETAGKAFYALRFTIHAIAQRCLFNPSVRREYDRALFLSLLGALKYTNLTPHAKHLLYLSAAHLSQML